VGISLRQFEQMKDRVNGKSLAATKRSADGPRVAHPLATPEQNENRSPVLQTILGIDPSLRGTGYGVIRVGKSCSIVLAQGTISCPAGWERSRCLAEISRTLRKVLREHPPTVCVVEGLFYAQNLQTALIMGEARGAAMAAVAENGIEIFEIATRKVKQAIVGYGAAQKIAVAKMVQRMLRLAEIPAPDAADALALALTHAQENGRYSLRPRKKI
jgi:crossover junction endodeoxyribonuclease RuvC